MNRTISLSSTLLSLLLVSISLLLLLPQAEAQVTIALGPERTMHRFGFHIWEDAEDIHHTESHNAESGILEPILTRTEMTDDLLIKSDQDSKYSIDIDGQKVKMLDGHRFTIHSALPPSDGDTENDWISVIGYVFHGNQVIPAIGKLNPQTGWCPFAEVTVDGKLERPRSQQFRQGNYWAALFDSHDHLDFITWQNHNRFIKHDVTDVEYSIGLSGEDFYLYNKYPAKEVSLVIFYDDSRPQYILSLRMKEKCVVKELTAATREGFGPLWDVTLEYEDDDTMKETIVTVASDAIVIGDFLEENLYDTSLVFEDEGDHALVVYSSGWMVYSRNPELNEYEQVLALNERNIATLTSTTTYQHTTRGSIQENIDGVFGLFRLPSYYTFNDKEQFAALARTSLTALLDEADRLNTQDSDQASRLREVS